MGDPRKHRKKYSKPSHPWQKTRIDEEKVLMVEYGLKNKKDLWRMSSRLGNFKNQAKALISRTDEQSEKEKKLFLVKLSKLNLVTTESTLDDVLDLSVKDLLERRLQTLVFRKGFARTVKQSRQMIVHRHVLINNQKVNVPSFLVPISMESSIEFHPTSAFIDEEHPERKTETKPVEEIKIKEEIEEPEVEKISDNESITKVAKDSEKDPENKNE